MNKFYYFLTLLVLIALALPLQGSAQRESSPVASMTVSSKPLITPTSVEGITAPIPEFYFDYPKANEPTVDVAQIILANSWGVQVSRGENNEYYAVLLVPPSGSAPHNWIKIYKNTGDPAVDPWSYVFGFYNPDNDFDFPDIEVVSSNDKGNVIFTMGIKKVMFFWFNLSSPTTNGFVTVMYDSTPAAHYSRCSITSDEVEWGGPNVYLYACWQWWDYLIPGGGNAIGFKRSVDGGATWTDETSFGVDMANLPLGNAIAYCPGDHHVNVCYTDFYGDVYVQESSLYGQLPWTYRCVMATTPEPIFAWGITSNYGGYILVCADVGISTPVLNYHVMYVYSSNGGTTWSPAYLFDYPGDQECPTCASNDDGYFSLLYPYSQSGVHWIQSARNVYSSLGTTSAWTEYSLGMVDNSGSGCSACIEDGTSPRFGGAWSTAIGSFFSSYFGWYEVIPALNVSMMPLNPPIVVPANGGTFQFNASVTRVLSPQAAFWVWARDRNPNGTYTGNLLGPVHINPPVGVTVTRQRTQNVPSTWPAGTHWYIGYAHTSVSYPATDADSFSWTMSASADGGPAVWDAICSGEPFPGEVVATGPTAFSLTGARPNPFNPTTAISFTLPEASRVLLKVYDTSGRLVNTLVDGWREAGMHEVTFDGSNLSSGVYLYTLNAGKFTATGKMALLK